MAQPHGEYHDDNADARHDSGKHPGRPRTHGGHSRHENAYREELEDGDHNCDDPGRAIRHQIQPSEEEHRRRQHRGRDDRAAINRSPYDLVALEGLAALNVPREKFGKEVSYPGRHSDSSNELGPVTEGDVRYANHAERRQDEDAAIGGGAHPLR